MEEKVRTYFGKKGGKALPHELCIAFKGVPVGMPGKKWPLYH